MGNTKRTAIFTNIRFFLIAASFLSMIFILGFTLWSGTTWKQVTLTVNGESEPIETRQAQVEGLLKEQYITLSEYDRVSHDLDQELTDGEEITVDLSVPVSIRIAGQIQQFNTHAVDVQSLLAEAGITLGMEDEMTPTMHAPLYPGMIIEITRVERLQELQEEEIPYTSIQQEDNEMLKGKTRLVQEGSKGLLVRTIEKVFRNDELLLEQVVSEEIARESQNEIVAIGTKNPVVILSSTTPDMTQMTLDGVTFGVKKVIDSVTLTAYDAGYNSTGKRKGDKGYGITSSGRTVEEGRTVAVDPKVIPMGWWMYIEGVGFRRAEDTGGAIKGNKIDVYFDSEKQALKFGRQKNKTVYVIGPDQPF